MVNAVAATVARDLGPDSSLPRRRIKKVLEMRVQWTACPDKDTQPLIQTGWALKARNNSQKVNQTMCEWMQMQAWYAIASNYAFWKASEYSKHLPIKKQCCVFFLYNTSTVWAQTCLMHSTMSGPNVVELWAKCHCVLSRHDSSTLGSRYLWFNVSRREEYDGVSRFFLYLS